MKTEPYVRKPFTVDAVRVTESNLDEVTEWCKGKIHVDYNEGDEAETVFIEVKVLGARNDRQTQAYVGDWVLRKDGNFKIYTPRAFENNFSPVYEEVLDLPCASTPSAMNEPSVHVPEEHV